MRHALLLALIYPRQDLVTALLLSEAIYKAAEGPPAAAAAALAALQTDFPPGSAPLQAVQFSRRAAGHRFLLARSADALFLAFQGTKRPADVLADATFLKRQLWDDDADASAADTEAAAAAVAEAAPAAHRGFLARAEAVPAEALYAHARRQGLRLVLCGECGLLLCCFCFALQAPPPLPCPTCASPADAGHSLGGAVAQLSTLRLLRAGADALRCITFGAPAVGDAALAALVRRQGWDSHFTSVALPGRWRGGAACSGCRAPQLVAASSRGRPPACSTCRGPYPSPAAAPGARSNRCSHCGGS